MSTFTDNKQNAKLNKKLNISQEDMPLYDSSFLNYSITENSVSDDKIKLKLRVSKRILPKVVLKQLDTNSRLIGEHEEKERSPIHSRLRHSVRTNITSTATPNPRRSTRGVPPVTYKEYNTPDTEWLKCKTPVKKHRESFQISPTKLGFEAISLSSPSVQTRQLLKSTDSKNNYKLNSGRKKLVLEEVHAEVDAILNPSMPVQPLEDSIHRTETKRIKIVPSTPVVKRNNMKLIRDGQLTPSMHMRQFNISHVNSPLNLAQEKLHVSYLPQALPCRETEFDDVYNFIKGKLMDGCGGCMYISGVPGTGKTATVTKVISELQGKSKKSTFTFVGINGMRLSDPRQSYVEILKQLTGKTVNWESAHSTLDAMFTKSKAKKSDCPIVLLVDELDVLCTKRQDVVYNLLDWPTRASLQLIVITIANTMDLPERLLMGRVTSRLGLTRLTFQAYTHKQLQQIVMKRLSGNDAFNSDAVQLVARKVASVSGDARRALDICRRAAELAELDGPTTQVSMQHVNNALNAMITQPKVRAIQRCSRLEQLLLQAFAAEMERTGIEETTFADIYTTLSSLSGINGFDMVSTTVAFAAISRLSTSRLLLTEQKSQDIHQRLILNVSTDDIYFALFKNN